MDENVDVAELVKQHAELGEQIVKLGGKVKYPETDDADLKAKKVERVVLDKGKKAAPVADDDEELDFDEDDDAEGKDKPMKKAEAEKTEAVVEKVADETVDFNGQTITKSVVGDAQFVIFKGMAAELAKATTDIAKAQDDALMARLEKRAGDDYAHVPGSVQERAAMLKAVGAMGEDLQKSFQAVFAQSEALAKSAFDTVGIKGGDSEGIKKSKQDFEAKVNEIAKRDSLPRSEAMAKARKENPDLFKAFQDN